MNKYGYLVYLDGAHVFRGRVIECVIKRMDDLDKVRAMIKEHHGIEFEELSACFTLSWWKFTNITDNRDINLIVERVNVLD